MTIALYSGSFDPITNGHIDILKKGTEIFDKVVIAVSYNINKQSFIPIDDRIKLIKQSIKEINNIEIVTYEGLTVEYAKSKNINILLRGLRNSNDFIYEQNMAQTNSALAPEIKTVFLPANNNLGFISSSMVKEVFLNGGNVSNFVPEAVNEYLKSKV